MIPHMKMRKMKSVSLMKRNCNSGEMYLEDDEGRGVDELIAVAELGGEKIFGLDVVIDGECADNGEI